MGKEAGRRYRVAQRHSVPPFGGFLWVCSPCRPGAQSASRRRVSGEPRCRPSRRSSDGTHAL